MHSPADNQQMISSFEILETWLPVHPKGFPQQGALQRAYRLLQEEVSRGRSPSATRRCALGRRIPTRRRVVSITALILQQGPWGCLR